MNICKQRISRLNRAICMMCKIPVVSVFVKYLLHIENSKGVLLRMPHPYNITINAGALIGENVTVYQGVTIGSSQFGRRMGIPEICDNVVIYPNSVIIGSVRVGRNAVVGAGSVVIDDIPDDAICAGNPARILRKLDQP